VQATLSCSKKFDFKRATYSLFFWGGGDMILGELKHFVLGKRKKIKKLMEEGENNISDGHLLTSIQILILISRRKSQTTLWRDHSSPGY